MAKGRKVQAAFSDGRVLTRTTQLNLTHAWHWRGTRGFDNGSANRDAGGSGFASSYALAEKAIASESGFILRKSKFHRHVRDWQPGTIDHTEIVAVVEVA